MTSQLTREARHTAAQTPGMPLPAKAGATLAENASRLEYAAHWFYTHNLEAETALYREWAQEARQAAEAQPDLLTALETILAALADEDGDLPDNGEYSGAALADLARSAIAQAKGL